MKFDKSMWLDGKPNQNPPNTTRINRNVIWDRSKGALTNEQGNLYISNFGNNRRVIGVISLDRNDFIVFSKSNLYNSVIGYVDEFLVYKELVNDTKLNFSVNWPIDGEFQRTTTNELVITFTDRHNPLRYYNVSRNTSIDNMVVFSDFNRPTVVSNISTGGNLSSGAWYPILKYEKEDGTTTSWVKDYNPIFIGVNTDGSTYSFKLGEAQAPNLPTNKSIVLSITGLDTRYKKVHVGLVFQANGIRLSYDVRSVEIVGSNSTIVIGNTNEFVAITLDEVTIDKAKYKTLDHIAQVNNTLYGVGVSVFSEPIQQSLANTLNLEWVTQLIDFRAQQNTFQLPEFNNRRRHFQHGEVYAFYIRLRYAWGFGQWWHIPGRPVRDSEKVIALDNFRRYQVYDTCAIGGVFSAWENENERYPSKDYYPGGNVRHHKFPSINWMKRFIYNNEEYYGSGKMDILNVKLSSIDLNQFLDEDGKPALGYEIGYAKRTEETASVVGQSIFIASGNWEATQENVYVSMGMNAAHANTPGHPQRIYLDTTKPRTYDYGMLYNKQSIDINYVRSEVVLKTVINFTGKSADYDYNNLRFALADFTLFPSLLPINSVTAVNKAKFIANNTQLDTTDNTFLEDTVVLDLKQGLGLPDIPNINPTVWADLTEYTQLISLLSIKRDMYAPFTNQQIIICDENEGPDLWGGDTYINTSSIVTFGNTGQRGSRTDPAASPEYNTPYNGVRIANFYLSESMLNTGFRYNNPTVLGGSTRFYPQDSYELYLPRLRRDQEPNMLIQGYSKDYNAQNDLTFSDVFNPVQLETRVSYLPFRAIRGQEYVRGSVISPWITFLPEDYYELSRTSGRVVNFAVGKDFLIFHHENALFTTRTTNNMQVDGETVFLGTGDLFQYPPVPIIHAEIGSLGTQHKWSCLMTPHGYFFIDAMTGSFVQFGDGIKILSQQGLREFFRNNSAVPGDNPFNSFGWHTSYDQTNERILVSKKHKKLLPDYEKNYKGIWRNDENFLSSLKVNDIVFKDGDYVFITK